MKNKIHYAPEALNDLEDIWDYISSNLFNPIAAENTVGNIQNAIDRLEDFPNIGTPLSAITTIKNDYHFLVSGNYLVFYRIIRPHVYIDRILYKKRNYLHILFPNLSSN